MTTGAKDTPAALYGHVSVLLGIIALSALAFGNYVGLGLPLLGGSLAVTFGIMGLRQGLNRVQCSIGLATGGLAVGFLVWLVMSFAA